MNILILNFAVAGYAGDTKQPLLIAKGLMNLGHHVVYATPDGDGYFFDEKKSKSYAEIRKKLLDAEGEIIEIEGVPILPIHCTSEKLGYYCPDAKMIAKKILPDFDVVYCLHWYYHLRASNDNHCNSFTTIKLGKDTQQSCPMDTRR